MPRTSKAEAELASENPVLTARRSELDHFTVEFTDFHIDADGTPAFMGLPDDRCQCTHWGYVVAGEFTLRYADGDETYKEGDAYLARPGHVPVVTTGTQLVEFSPTEQLAKTIAVLEANMAAMGEQ